MTNATSLGEIRWNVEHYPLIPGDWRSTICRLVSPLGCVEAGPTSPGSCSKTALPAMNRVTSNAARRIKVITR